MSIFSNEFNYNTNKMIAWFVVIILLTSMFLFAFPILTDPTIQPFIYNNINRIPEKLTSILLPFGPDTFNNIDSFFNTIMLFTQFLLSIFALSLGLISVAREQGFGTIDLLYINPVSRKEIVIKKFIANIILLLIINILIDIIATFIYIYLSESQIMDSINNNLILYISIFLETILFLSIGTMISCLSRRTAYMGLIGLIIVAGFLALYVSISTNILPINNSSIRALIPYNTTIEVLKNTDLILNIVILSLSKLVPAIIFLILGKLYYNRKDLIV